MPHKLTTGYLITRDICEMEEPKETDRTLLVDLDDLARRIDEAEAEQLTTLQSKSAALVDALGKIGNPVESCENCDRSCDTDKYPCHSCNKNGWSKGESFWKPQGHIVDSRAALAAFKGEK